MYEKYGPETFYKEFKHEYYNPHAQNIHKLFVEFILPYLSKGDKILDLACGDGLITRILQNINIRNVEGCDPFFQDIYMKKTDCSCSSLSFQDISLGKFNEQFDVVICCFAYHLIEKSFVYHFWEAMSEITDKFIIISPTKNMKLSHPKWKEILHIKENQVWIIVLQKMV
jgi:2-polyprenyl-3-methyl-5-hydroxy-6-metoxy-1,4-benzoquinol methylase